MKTVGILCLAMILTCQNVSANGLTIGAMLVQLLEPFSQGPQIELFLENYKGQQLGYDRKTGKVIEYLGESGSYGVEEGPGEGSPSSKQLELVADPLPGLYTLSMIGTETGIYGVDIAVVEQKEILIK